MNRPLSAINQQNVLQRPQSLPVAPPEPAPSHPNWSTDRPATSAKPRLRQIACWVDKNSDYGRDIALGVNQFAQSHAHWSVLHMALANDQIERWLQQHPCDGIVTQNASPVMAGLFKHHGVLAVNVSAKLAEPALPTVVSDNHAAGRLAAEHLLTCGLRQFAAINMGLNGSLHFAELRLQGFRDRLREAGHSVLEASFLNAAAHWNAAAQQLDTQSPHYQWLANLPKPIGLLAASHVVAPAVVRLCRAAAIRIPADVALVCVDEDLITCGSVSPSITSVGLNGLVVGFEAAHLLDRLIDGEAGPAQRTLIPPVQLVARESTAVSPVQDRRVTQALAYIQAHCHRQIYVEDIARHLGISRSALQHMFVVVNGRSLIEEINRARVKQAQHLLATTDIPMSQIASRCGFRRPQYFAKVFRTHAGMNARAYRLAAAKLPVVSNQTNEYQSNVQPSAQVPQ